MNCKRERVRERERERDWELTLVELVDFTHLLEIVLVVVEAMNLFLDVVLA